MSGTPEERVAGLHAAFSDPDVKGIISFIGGNNSNQLVDLLDYDLIRKNPKVFVGYSDMSVLHYAFQKAGLVSFYGPAALTQFAEFPRMLDYTRDYFARATMSSDPIGRVSPSEKWTDEVLDWMEKKDMERPRELRANEGWTWLRKGKASGPILGGCITSIAHLRGTQYWPDHVGAILLLETPEGEDISQGESLASIDAALQDFRLMGLYDQIKGLIVGRPFGYSEEAREQYKQVILDRTEGHSFPVLYNVNVGHADPVMTVPLGVETTIDSERDTFTVDEAGVQ